MSAVETRPDLESSAEAETARLFEAHSGEILAYCRRHLPSSAEADDAVQTTFLYALRGLRRGVEPECDAAWLTAIARNVCLTERRTLGRRARITAEVDIERVALAMPEPEETEIVAALPGALAALPENQRNALVMREWQGLGAAEIASRLGLTPTATCALLTRARRSVANTLTAAGRTRSALNLGVLLELVRSQLRTLLGGAVGKAAVGVVVATVAIGGVVAERSHDASSPRTTTQVTTSAGTRATRPRLGDVSARSAVARSAATGARLHVARVGAVGPRARTARVAPAVGAQGTPVAPAPPASPAPTLDPGATAPSFAPSPVVPALPTPPAVPVPSPALPTLPAVPVPSPALPTLDLPSVTVSPSAPEPPLDDPQVPPLPSLP